MVRSDDWRTYAGPDGERDPHCGPGHGQRLTDVEQIRIGDAYLAMFLRWQVGGEAAWSRALIRTGPHL